MPRLFGRELRSHQQPVGRSQQAPAPSLPPGLGRQALPEAQHEGRPVGFLQRPQRRLGDAPALHIVGVDHVGLKLLDLLGQFPRQPPPRPEAGAVQGGREVMAAGTRQIPRARPGGREHQRRAAGIMHGAGRGHDIASQRTDIQLRDELEHHGPARFRTGGIGGNPVVERARDRQAFPLP